MIIGLVFSKIFQFENEKIQTTNINPLLLKLLVLTRLCMKKKGQFKKIELVLSSGEDGSTYYQIQYY
jgi:hypothetical protein